MYSNKVYCRQFAVSRTTTSCSSRTERHARHSPHCRLPSFQCAGVHWTRKLATEQTRSKSRELFSVDSVVADGIASQNFRHNMVRVCHLAAQQLLHSGSTNRAATWWTAVDIIAEASYGRLLGSAKPGHTEPSDWSAAKKTDDGYQRKVWSCWILSGLTICVRDCLCFNVFWMKIEQNSCIIDKFNAISGVLMI